MIFTEKPMSQSWDLGIDPVLIFKIFLNLHGGGSGLRCPLFLAPLHSPRRIPDTSPLEPLPRAVDGGSTDSFAPVAGQQDHSLLNF